MGGLSQGLSWVCPQDVGWDCGHLKVWLQLQVLLPRWFIHMTVGQKTADPSGSWQQLRVPWHINHCVELLEWSRDVAACFPQCSSWLFPERLSWEQGGSHNAFYALILYLIRCHFYHIVFSRNKSLSTTHPDREQIRLCFLKGEVSKESVSKNYFNYSTLLFS